MSNSNQVFPAEALRARNAMADEIAGWPIGAGYESVTLGLDEARAIVDALTAAGFGLMNEDSCCCGGMGCGL